MLYAGWLRMGFTHEAILLAARHACARNKMEDVTRYLQSWAKQSLYTAGPSTPISPGAGRTSSAATRSLRRRGSPASRPTAISA